jgi:hypothetical protein
MRAFLVPWLSAFQAGALNWLGLRSVVPAVKQLADVRAARPA